MQEEDAGHVTAFKQAQQRHRRRGDDPNRIDDMEEWIDFARVRAEDQRIIRLPPLPKESNDGFYRGPLYGLNDYPGFVFAPQALSDDVQIELAYRAVTEYCEHPHKTNIDPCAPKLDEIVDESSRMWMAWKEENKRQPCKKPRTGPPSKRHYRSFKKLSWATMGYHYDWTERSYHENLKSDMPALVGRISTIFARTCLHVQGNTGLEPTFEPTASIVNFYTTKSIMGGHRDDLELALDKPIVSISMGLPAVFLLGGRTKDDGPVLPVLIRSGDVLCMGGESRLNYHGMARLIPSPSIVPPPELECCPPSNHSINLSDVHCDKTVLCNEERDALDCFLTDHRININVRQVFPS